MPPVFRFAPSPNGYLHLGHALSALLNADLARAAGGRLLLRIEDIDETRCRPEYEAAVYEDLAWLGIAWERPVWRQSDHYNDYRAALARLEAMGLVYPSFESRAEIAALAARREPWPRDPDGAPLYPGDAKAMPAAVRKRRMDAGEPYALRLDMAGAMVRTGKLTLNEKLTWTETDQGLVVADPAANPVIWGDVILARKDTPTSYHLAVVVDDAAQGVTDVVRGRDLFQATSVHRLLQTLLEFPAPRYRHHRLILGADGKKLSKSTAATGLRELRTQGVTPADIRRWSGSIEPRFRGIVGWGRGTRMAKRRKAKRKVRRKARPRRAARAPSPRAIEAALAGIAHDIRTPLTGIVALAELLAASDLRQREREWANAVKSGAEHLAALSTLIVDAVKADVTGLTLRHAPFSPRALAQAVGQGLTARAGNKNVKAQFAIDDGLPPTVAGDQLRLRAALENLCDNAVKFTSAGAVSFTASAEPAARGRVRLVFTVTDSGIGMSAAELKRLFRPFAQASVDIARRYGGAGLGLSFVKRIAKAMGGDLKVTSRTGAGSTFRLTVLVERVAARLTPEQARTQPARALTLLCAEDNPYGRVVMNTILSELGHRVDFVETGEAAVKAAERGGYDAVLMDVTLSGLDGLEATRRIRALLGKPGQVPVIGISGRGASADEAAARAAGMNFYFSKPVSPGKLAAALAMLG